MPVRKSAAVSGHRKWKVCPRLHMELSRVERRRADDGCTHVAVHKSFMTKNACVTADVKQRIGLRFMFNIAGINQFGSSADL